METKRAVEVRCDMHDDDAEATETYAVTRGGVTVVLDVCADHGAPFRLALAVGSRGPRGRASRAARSASHAVKPFEW